MLQAKPHPCMGTKVQHLYKLLTLFLLWSSSLTNAAPTTKTFGYFSDSFPFDLTEVDSPTKESLLTQVFDPLVRATPNGTIEPALASHWKIKKQGREIHITLKPEIRFSNGHRLTATDVKYSLDQIGPVQIGSIEVVSNTELILHLDSPHNGFVQLLSQSSLAIVPHGWKFDASSPEPYIGTGPYRMVRHLNDWYLVQNHHYRAKNEITTDHWRLAFKKSDTPLSKTKKIPDLIPFLNQAELNQLKKNPRWNPSRHKVELVPRSLQTSAWWFPHGNTFNRPFRRALGMEVARALLADVRRDHDLPEVTGLIPEGFPGHLKMKPLVGVYKHKGLKDRHFAFAIPQEEFSRIVQEHRVLKFEHRYDVTLDLIPFDPYQVRFLAQKRPDVVVLSHGETYRDPEGFIAPLSTLFRSHVPVILGLLSSLHHNACREQDPDRRKELFQDLNRAMIRSSIVVPAWATRGYRIRRKSTPSPLYLQP